MDFYNNLGSKYRLISSINKHGYRPVGKRFTLKTVFKDRNANQEIKFNAVSDANLNEKLQLNGKDEVSTRPGPCTKRAEIIHITSNKKPLREIHKRGDDKKLYKKNNIPQATKIVQPDDFIIHRVGNDVKSITRIHTLKKGGVNKNHCKYHLRKNEFFGKDLAYVKTFTVSYGFVYIYYKKCHISSSSSYLHLDTKLSRKDTLQDTLFFLSRFSSQPFTNHRTAGEGEEYSFNSSLPLPPASHTFRH